MNKLAFVLVAVIAITGTMVNGFQSIEVRELRSKIESNEKVMEVNTKAMEAQEARLNDLLKKSVVETIDEVLCDENL